MQPEVHGNVFAILILLSALDLEEEIIPMLENLCLVLREIRNVTMHPFDVLGCGEQTLTINSIRS